MHFRLLINEPLTTLTNIKGDQFQTRPSYVVYPVRLLTSKDTFKSLPKQNPLRLSGSMNLYPADSYNSFRFQADLCKNTVRCHAGQSVFENEKVAVGLIKFVEKL